MVMHMSCMSLTMPTEVKCKDCGATGTIEDRDSFSTLMHPILEIPCAKCGNLSLEHISFLSISNIFLPNTQKPRMILDPDQQPISNNVSTYKHEYKQEKKRCEKVELENDELRHKLSKHDPKTRPLVSQDYYFPYSVEGYAWAEDQRNG